MSSYRFVLFLQQYSIIMLLKIRRYCKRTNSSHYHGHLTSFLAVYISIFKCLTLRGLSLGMNSDIEPSKILDSSSVAKLNCSIFFMRRRKNRILKVLYYHTKRRQ